MNNLYKKSGVNVKAGNEVVQEIKDILKTSYQKNVFKNSIGMFAGGFDISQLGYKKPVLFSSTDGVGTKTILAINNNMIENIGQDLVAMCVNDIICHGAKPLFFLDYIGINKIDLKTINKIISSIVLTLNNIDCALIGGETAELKLVYKKNDFDLVGMVTGICEKDKIILSNKVEPGQLILALESSGPHSNGYSLINKMVVDKTIDLKCKLPSNKEVIKALLTPTTIYVSPILELIKKVSVKGLANNTGGGIFENLPRCFPEGVGAIISEVNLPNLEVFDYLTSKLNCAKKELYSMWNMGMGFFIVIDKTDLKDTQNIIKKHGINLHIIGETKKMKHEVVIN